MAELLSSLECTRVSKDTGARLAARTRFSLELDGQLPAKVAGDNHGDGPGECEQDGPGMTQKVRPLQGIRRER